MFVDQLTEDRLLKGHRAALGQFREEFEREVSLLAIGLGHDRASLGTLGDPNRFVGVASLAVRFGGVGRCG
jgi:hypothetical protein